MAAGPPRLTSPFYRGWAHQVTLAPWKTETKTRVAQSGQSTLHSESFLWTCWTCLYGLLVSSKNVFLWEQRKPYYSALVNQKTQGWETIGHGEVKSTWALIWGQSSKDSTAWRASASAYLSIWPIVFGEDGIIGVYGPIGDKHDGLAADASLSRMVELWKERGSKQTHVRERWLSMRLQRHKVLGLGSLSKGELIIGTTKPEPTR